MFSFLALFARKRPHYLDPVVTRSFIQKTLQQTTFENIEFVTKGEIAQNEQFLFLPQSFQLVSVI